MTGNNGAMRYRLRSLLIALAFMPPLLAGAWSIWPRAQERPNEQVFDSFDEFLEELRLLIPGGPVGPIDEFDPQCFVVDANECCDDQTSQTGAEDDLTPEALPTASTDDPFAR